MAGECRAPPALPTNKYTNKSAFAGAASTFAASCFGEAATEDKTAVAGQGGATSPTMPGHVRQGGNDFAR
jgi:hypothetical protein